MSTRGGQQAVHDRSTRSEPPPGDDGPVESVPQDPAHLERCGQILEARRLKLRLSLRKAAKQGGMAHSTLRDFEAGRRAPVYLHTFSSLDDVYEYLPGSVRALYLFGQRPVPKGAPPRPEPPPLPTDQFPVGLSPKLLDDLLDVSKRLADKAQASGDPELTALQLEAKGYINRVFLAWLVAQVEGSRAAGNGNGFMKTVLSEQLRGMPVTEDDPDEIAYIRWLLGRSDGLSAEDITRYEQLFATRTRRRTTDADADA